MSNFQLSEVKDAIKETVCGTIAGITGISFGYPLDTIKVRLQTQHIYSGFLDCLLTTIRTNGILDLYKGMTSPIFGYAFSSATVFFSYGRALRFQKNSADEPTTLQMAVIAGAASGMFSTLVTNPIDRVKILMQAPDTRLFPSTYYCARHIVQTQGYKSLYYGLTANLMKETYGAGLWFGIYHGLKGLLTKPDQEATLSARIISGGLAGSLAWTLIYPLDVIRSRMMSEVDVKKPQYKNTVACWQQSFKREGLTWCFKGYLPTVIRGFPVGATILTTNDYLLRLTKNI